MQIAGKDIVEASSLAKMLKSATEMHGSGQDSATLLQCVRQTGPHVMFLVDQSEINPHVVELMAYITCVLRLAKRCITDE
jgi:hypothetical protein